MSTAVGYATHHSFTALHPLRFERRPVQEQDVEIDILFCGVCRSDLHQAENDWKNTVYPCLPGHEIVGRVRAVGSAVSGIQVGALVGVGCMVDSCGRCPSCQEGLEQYCEGPIGATLTYNGPTKPDGSNTYGGYSTHIVVQQHFVIPIPAGIEAAHAAPLLCAGITTFSPLRHWRVGPGMQVGIIGMGGLGHVAVQIATALGATVSVISTSADKEGDARRFGARHFLLSTDRAAMQEHALSFDVLLSTIPEAHDVNPYVSLLKRDGTLVLVGCLTPLSRPTDQSQVAYHRRSIAGSLIGGVAETAEVLAFCATHRITPQIQMIPMSGINAAFHALKKGTVRYRQVIDVAGTLSLADSPAS
jgi:uncharacterized zinc-type alcohol dehydrogenase-like protein